MQTIRIVILVLTVVLITFFSILLIDRGDDFSALTSVNTAHSDVRVSRDGLLKTRIAVRTKTSVFLGTYITRLKTKQKTPHARVSKSFQTTSTIGCDVENKHRI